MPGQQLCDDLAEEGQEAHLIPLVLLHNVPQVPGIDYHQTKRPGPDRPPPLQRMLQGWRGAYHNLSSVGLQGGFRVQGSNWSLLHPWLS